MPELIDNPTSVSSIGNKPKKIQEFFGRAHTGDAHVSVARMSSPEGWEEPGQRPEFDEITLVLRGRLCVEHEAGQLNVRSGQAVIARTGEWIRYSTPDVGGADYIAVCAPAFSIQTVNRDE